VLAIKVGGATTIMIIISICNTESKQFHSSILMSILSNGYNRKLRIAWLAVG
jgi:hypothetical protein